MSKTKFKCMFLIDQALYNKKIIGSDNSDPTSKDKKQPLIDSNIADRQNPSYILIKNQLVDRQDTPQPRIVTPETENSRQNIITSDNSEIITNNQARKEKCLDCSKQEVEMQENSFRISPKETLNENKNTYLVDRSIQKTDDEHMMDESEPVSNDTVSSTSPNVSDTLKYDDKGLADTIANTEKEQAELKERLRKLREDFPNESPPKDLSTQENKTPRIDKVNNFSPKLVIRKKKLTSSSLFKPKQSLTSVFR